MYQKLTNLWPGLLRRVVREDGDEEEEPFVHEGQMKELEESYLNVHPNEWWTRVVSLQSFFPNIQEKYRLGQDMASEADFMFRIDVDQLPEWAAQFDPVVFQNEHRDIELSAWKLTDEQLKS